MYNICATKIKSTIFEDGSLCFNRGFYPYTHLSRMSLVKVQIPLGKCKSSLHLVEIFVAENRSLHFSVHSLIWVHFFIFTIFLGGFKNGNLSKG